MTRSAQYPAWMEERMKSDSNMLELAPDEARAVSLFIALDTQWDRHAMTGVRLGIDYSRIPAVAQMMDIAMTPALLMDIRIMEGAALGEYAKAARR